MIGATPLFNTWGPLIGLAIAIVLIVFKLHPFFSLLIGAIIGGLLGSIGNFQGLPTIVTAITTGAGGMATSVLRILASGVLAGALIMTGAAEKIANSIIKLLGKKLSIIAVAISTMIICMVGVFIDISVITVAPIALSIGKKTNLPTPAILLAMIGGGKAGNIISPNPNTIATAEAYKIPLMDLIVRNIIPAVCALAVTILISLIMVKVYRKKKMKAAAEGNVEANVEVEEKVEEAPKTTNTEEPVKKEPNIFQALAGPLVVIAILILRPTANVDIDPLIALPVGGIVTILVCGYAKNTIKIMEFGLSKVVGIGVLLLGTGAIAGIISNSSLQTDLKNLLTMMNLPAFLLAPFSGFLMAAATASTTSGTTIASQTFSQTLISSGVSPLGAAAMTHASATILDSLPHGSFFHATGGSVSMEFKDRLKLIPLEACVGLTSTVVSVIIFLIIG